MLAGVSQSSAPDATRVERECLRAAAVVGVGAGVVGVLLWAASFPGWPLAAGVVLSVLVVAATMIIMAPEPPPVARRLRPLGVVIAVALALVGGVAVQQASAAVVGARFERSRPAFENAVAGAEPVPRTVSETWLPFAGECPERLGSYRVSACHAFTGGFMFLQQRSAWGDEAGFAYVPDGLWTSPDGTKGLPISGFTHLDGPWYAWSCGC